jgi:hypothetical protein
MNYIYALIELFKTNLLKRPTLCLPEIGKQRSIPERQKWRFFMSVCSGCQRDEMHKRCPAHGTPFYMSGVEYTKEIERLVNAGLVSAESAFTVLSELKTKKRDEIPFEIHITMNKCISNVNASTAFEHKTIEIEDLAPDGYVVQTTWMTSIVKNFKTFTECMQYVSDIKKHYIHINRVKVEVPPFYLSYYGGKGLISEVLYAECHFESPNFICPTSRNVKKSTLMATARVMRPDLSELSNFIDDSGDDDVELCIYDTNLQLDHEWMTRYEDPRNLLRSIMLGKN